MAGRPQRRARIAAGLPAPSGNGSRPPFESGNQAALRHGGYSMVGLGDRASEIAEEIRPTLPAYSTADEPTVLLLATTLARIERASTALDAANDETLATLHRLSDDLRAWVNSARRLGNDLGLTPTSRAKLGLDIAATRREISVIEYYEARERAGLPLYDEEADR